MRLHYQVLILSGGYLLATLFVDFIDWGQYIRQFVNVHIFLFGGATVFNSFWDKDEGPIGGLKHPPKMKPWMRPVSMVMQFFALAWCLTISVEFTVIYGISLLLFWLYSSPKARWKGHPLLSLIAIGISTGTNSFLLGILATGQPELRLEHIIASIGVACIILSLYPISQIYQMEEDSRRGDVTFTMKYGLGNAKRFFLVLFPAGVLIISTMMYPISHEVAMPFFLCGIFAFVLISMLMTRLIGSTSEYNLVMRMKFLASFSFVMFILSSLLIKSII